MEYTLPIFKEMLLPLGAWNRTGKLIRSLRYITIHETSLGTDLEPAFKDVDYYINKIMHPDENRKFIGYHYLISDDIVIRFIKDHEFTCHAGKFGNKVSLGVERIVNESLNHERAVFNQALVAATLMKKHNIPLKNVVPHKYWPPSQTKDYKYWTNKECPGRLLAGMFGGWQYFIETVEMLYRNRIFLIELF